MQTSSLQSYTPRHKLRFITATALFDGHDASINIMRRLLQARGAEVIHLGHNRSAAEVAEAAIQEDAHAIALSSYQGGHMEFFKYVRQLLDAGGGRDIKIFGGGGGGAGFLVTIESIKGNKNRITAILKSRVMSPISHIIIAVIAVRRRIPICPPKTCNVLFLE